jgi:nucleosome assembly protein 1-like 1
MNNPALLNALQDKLDTLVGTSRYISLIFITAVVIYTLLLHPDIENLPPAIQRRIRALEKLQSKNLEIEQEFRAAVLELEKKYHNLHQPLYDLRSEFVSGKTEPLDEQCAIADLEPIPKPENDSTSGIPEFWLTAFKNHPMIDSMITEEDDGALKHLIDVQVAFLEGNPLIYKKSL